jgi:hypothetical protein
MGSRVRAGLSGSAPALRGAAETREAESRKKEETKMRKSGDALLWAVGLMLAVVAAWQFYLYAAFRDARGVVDLQGGGPHLWAAIGAAVVACAVVGSAIFRRINKPEEFHITS